MVATKAFGIGIDKSDIRHVICNGVPESVTSWAQEFGRAGRDGLHSTATILYRRSDMRHADSWIRNHVNDQEKCCQILSDFTNSWWFVEAHLAGYCRRKMLLELLVNRNRLLMRLAVAMYVIWTMGNQCILLMRN